MSRERTSATPAASRTPSGGPGGPPCKFEPVKACSPDGGPSDPGSSEESESDDESNSSKGEPKTPWGARGGGPGDVDPGEWLKEIEGQGPTTSFYAPMKWDQKYPSGYAWVPRLNH